MYRAFFAPNGTDYLGLFDGPEVRQRIRDREIFRRLFPPRPRPRPTDDPPVAKPEPKAGCICGVESFVVTYMRRRTHTGGGTSFVTIRTDITFKKDEQHDPAQCEFRQFTCKANGFSIQVGPTEWRVIQEYDGTWRDDDYTRADDMDGKPELPEPGFWTLDGPGDEREIDDRWNIKWVFKSQQAVYDIGRKVWVAATPPVTVTVTGTHPRSYAGIPDGDKVHGVPGQEVFGDYVPTPD